MTATFVHYVHLLRLHKPIGILLLLWPTLWGLWLASGGVPSIHFLCIFILGTVLMRSAGCAINDYADRHIDAHVTRTRMRPLAMQQVKPKQALTVAAFLALIAFILVCQCNFLTICLSFVGVLLAAAYPFLKRVTHLPQVGLGLAFSWGVPMAFAAVQNHVPVEAWYLFAVSALWPIIYDTQYAMVDREDDLKIGVKSTAILFAEYDYVVIAVLQCLFILLLGAVGVLFELTRIYDVCIFVVALLFLYQQWLIHTREPGRCFQAFLNNQWVGLVVFFGIVLGLPA